MKTLRVRKGRKGALRNSGKLVRLTGEPCCCNGVDCFCYGWSIGDAALVRWCQEPNPSTAYFCVNESGEAEVTTADIDHRASAVFPFCNYPDDTDTSHFQIGEKVEATIRCSTGMWFQLCGLDIKFGTDSHINGLPFTFLTGVPYDFTIVTTYIGGSLASKVYVFGTYVGCFGNLHGFSVYSDGIVIPNRIDHGSSSCLEAGTLTLTRFRRSIQPAALDLSYCFNLPKCYWFAIENPADYPFTLKLTIAFSMLSGLNFLNGEYTLKKICFKVGPTEANEGTCESSGGCLYSKCHVAINMGTEEEPDISYVDIHCQIASAFLIVNIWGSIGTEESCGTDAYSGPPLYSLLASVTETTCFQTLYSEVVRGDHIVHLSGGSYLGAFYDAGKIEYEG